MSPMQTWWRWLRRVGGSAVAVIGFVAALDQLAAPDSVVHSYLNLRLIALTVGVAAVLLAGRHWYVLHRDRERDLQRKLDDARAQIVAMARDGEAVKRYAVYYLFWEEGISFAQARPVDGDHVVAVVQHAPPWADLILSGLAVEFEDRTGAPITRGVLLHRAGGEATIKLDAQVALPPRCIARPVPPEIADTSDGELAYLLYLISPERTAR